MTAAHNTMNAMIIGASGKGLIGSRNRKGASSSRTPKPTKKAGPSAVSASVMSRPHTGQDLLSLR